MRNTAENKLRLCYIAADYASTLLAVLIFNAMRYYSIPSAATFPTLAEYLLAPRVLAGEILFPPGMLLVYYLTGYYSEVAARSRVNEFFNTLLSALIGTLVIIFVALINDLTNNRKLDYHLFFAAYTLLFGIVYISRYTLTRIIARHVRKGNIWFPTAIAGWADNPDLWEKHLSRRMPDIGLKPIMLVDATNTATPNQIGPGGLPVVRLSQFLEHKCRETHSVVVLTRPESPNHAQLDTAAELVEQLYPTGLNIFVATQGVPLHMPAGSRLVSMRGEPLIDVSHTHLPPSTMAIKRAFDVLGSSVALALSAIPITVLAIMVRLNSPGPAFYTQKRVGRHRRDFTIYKLRTMHTDAEADGVPRLSSDNDPRVTSLGRILRRYRLDELPQFFNVLRGDMSLVGPRPERRQFMTQIEQICPAHAVVYRLRPGLTSLAVVKFGYASNIDQMIKRTHYDFIYMQNLSVTTDLKIIIYTIRTVVHGRGV